MNFNEFVNTYLNRRIDYDGQFGVQCVDLFNCYCVKCLALHIGFFPYYAKDYWLKRNTSKWLKDNFDFIKLNYSKNELQKGDIGIRTSGTKGHIFIIEKQNNDGTFTYYDQNHTGEGDAMTKRTATYNNLVISGVLRPKNKRYICDIPHLRTGPYKLTNIRGVYNGYGANTKRKKVKDLTKDGKKHATSSKRNADAYLKANTTITILELKVLTNRNVWARIPSGYICIFEADKIKKFVKEI